MQEKLATIRKLDDEIALQTEDEEALTQGLIEADEFSQRIYEALIKIEKCFASTSASPETYTVSRGTRREQDCLSSILRDLMEN